MEKYISRAIAEDFRKKILPQKVLILLGARRVGKTEFLRHFILKYPSSDYLYLNGEDQQTIDALSERTIRNYKRLIGKKNILIIDEAQKIPGIGQKLKLMVDELDGLKVIATGSSVFDLGNKLGEPLVGRQNTILLYPLAQMELAQEESYFETKARIEERLIFGSYPEILQYNNWDDKAEYLEGLVNTYLLRDLLEYDGIRRADKIIDLLRLISFQIGKEVSIDELANSLKGISRNTVEYYLDLLAKVFIIYKFPGFSRNLRKEVTKTSRWYFYDNGIRNAIIRNFQKLNMRADVGELWENYLIAERLKYSSYNKKRVNQYFWRTYDRQELDLVEEEAGELRAFEFKWNPKRKTRIPGGWAKAYPDATFELINSDNYLDFIS